MKCKTMAEQKNPPRSLVNSDFYRTVNPTQNAPMKKDIGRADMKDEHGRQYTAVDVKEKESVWQDFIEDQMRGYDADTHIFCWIKLTADHELPEVGDVIKHKKSGIEFTVTECGSATTNSGKPRTRNTGFAVLKISTLAA